MNILMCNYEYPPLGGGGGVVHELIAEELAQRHRVCVITSAYRDLPSHEVRNGVEIHRVPVLGRSETSVASLVSMLSYPAPATMQALRLLGRERFDVMNGHFAVPTGPASLAAAKRARIPHVISLHGGDIYDPSKRFSPHRVAGARWAVRTVLRHSDAVVAQSRNTSENARRYYGFTGPIEIIPLGIRPMDVPLATRAELGLPEDVF
ncbi:MAG TPA: glycosyltransferase family 4 protein, partial [Gemmatimonadaceae bacterium]|nr:glycosyltransferase family 4 protein [Gemmatimonadaceae bacterium]